MEKLFILSFSTNIRVIFGTQQKLSLGAIFQTEVEVL